MSIEDASAVNKVTYFTIRDGAADAGNEGHELTEEAVLPVLRMLVRGRMLPPLGLNPMPGQLLLPIP